MTELGIDLGTVGVLAALIVLEGGRKVPPGSLLLRRTLLGPWAVLEPPSSPRRWRFVSWFPPFVTTVVIPPRAGEPPADRLEDRLRSVRRPLLALRVLGGAVVVGIVAGLPLAVGIAGAAGFALAVAALLTLSVTIALVAGRALGRLSVDPTRRRRQMLAWLWPFTSPFAVETVIEAAARDANHVDLASRLLTDQDFRRWIRPRAYDAMMLGQDDPELVAAVSPAMLREIIGATGRGIGARSECPRCGALFVVEEGHCSDCEIPLAPMPMTSIPET